MEPIDEVAILYEQGLAYADAGLLPEARAALQQVYRLNPTRTEAICALARLERENGDLEAARTLLANALDLHPADAGLCLELGCVFQETGQLEYALNYYRDAIKASPEFAEAWHQLGRLFQQLERPVQAEEAYTHALSLDPTNARAWNNLGMLHYFQNRTEPSRSAYAKAAELRPDRGEYHFNLGMSLLMHPVDKSAAFKAFDLAIKLKPSFGQELANIGDHFFYTSQTQLAAPFFEHALLGEVDDFTIYLKLAQCAERSCEMQKSLDYYHKALDLRPDQWLIKVRAGLLLPMIYQSPEEVMTWRQQFVNNLNYLHDMIRREKLPHAVQNLTMFSPCFLLAYQGLDNLHPAMHLSDLWRKLFVLPATARSVPRTGKRRIGLISAFFFQHSVAGNYVGLVRELKRRGHELFFFSIGMRKHDEVTAELQTLGHWQTLPTDLPLPKLADKVIAADLDMVIYPEIGLEPLTYTLAHARLAPVQVQLCGHPMSSGIATVDYFISGKKFELPHAQEQYNQTLIQMEQAPFEITRPVMPDPILSRRELGVPETGRLYFISCVLFKLHPNHDPIFAELLTRDPEGWLILIQPTTSLWYDKLWQRFERTLGPLIERVKFVPWMPQPSFYSLLLQSDAALDTLHFGSGNVAYQALGLGVPMITLPGSSLRSRSTFGIYEQMGMRDCVANSPQEYVELALKLAQDKEWQQAMRQKALMLSEKIFGDTGATREIADFIEEVQPR